MNRSRWLLLGVLGISAALVAVAWLNQPKHDGRYPEKPIQIVVPFSAGGDADQSARNLAAYAHKFLGQPMVVVNQAGSNGVIGSQVVRDARPDGYTLLLARVGPQVLLPALQPKITKYRWNDFTFLGLLDLNPVVCVVHADSPYKTFKDLVKALREKPGKLSYSHPGVATVPNLTPQLLLNNLGLKSNAAINVPYKGGGEATLAVLSQEVDFSCGNLSSMIGNLAAGKLRPLMTTTQERLEKWPDVPTARETGFPQLETMLGWSALYGPPNMDTEAVHQWTSALKSLASDAGWIQGTKNFGGIPKILSPSETEEFAKESFFVYQHLTQEMGSMLD